MTKADATSNGRIGRSSVSSLRTWTLLAPRRSAALSNEASVPVDLAVVNGQVTLTWRGPYTLSLTRVAGNGRRTGLAIKAPGPTLSLTAALPSAGGFWECTLYEGVVARTFRIGSNTATR